MLRPLLTIIAHGNEDFKESIPLKNLDRQAYPGWKQKLHHNVYCTNSIYMLIKYIFVCLISGPILFAVVSLQDIASPVFQNHKTKEWTNLDNITFSFDCRNRPVGFYADMEYNCQVNLFLYKSLIK